MQLTLPSILLTIRAMQRKGKNIYTTVWVFFFVFVVFFIVVVCFCLFFISQKYKDIAFFAIRIAVLFLKRHFLKLQSCLETKNFRRQSEAAEE